MLSLLAYHLLEDVLLSWHTFLEGARQKARVKLRIQASSLHKSTTLLDLIQSENYI